MNAKSNLVPTWWEQKSFKEFKAEYKNSERPLFFIGSGISRWMGLPDWKGLLISLAEYYESKKLDPATNLVNDVKSKLQEASKNPSTYKDVGSFIYKKFAKVSTHLWREALEHILNNPEIIKHPSEIHDTIIKLKWHRIITPNYDQLIELAAMRKQLKIGVAHPWNEEEMKKVETSSTPYIFKIHGDITDRTSQIILTEEDYDMLYSDHAPQDPEIENIFKRNLGSVLRTATTTLFMGYSHDDPYLKKLYSDAMIGAETSKVFALVERTGEDFEKRIDELSNNLKIKFISYSGDKHSELLEFLKYLSAPEATDAYYRQLLNVKKPTIIMLHCGGTISSSPKTSLEDSLSVVKKNSRYDKELVSFSTKLLNWYKNTYNSGNNLDIDIIWEILPEEFQMFSENATPELWNEMTKKIKNIIFKYFHAPEISEDTPMSKNEELKSLYNEENEQYKNEPNNNEDLQYTRFLSEFKNRYILGVIILFGTDTLAYLAPALSLSLQHLPCPIVITGANQSPKESGIDSTSQYFVTSDSWKNLMMSMYFLQCFGHRLREVFVCFGNTVHNCINLRKRAAEIVPSGHHLISNPSLEPFSYRNVSPYYQYMFKCIDGIFCNNYYVNNYTVMMNPDFRHIRHDALRPTPTQRMIGDNFSAVVQHVTVTPNFPLIDVKGMLSHQTDKIKLRAFLVEGYPSGTYPTYSDNNFTRMLNELYENGIPVILVSRYGILANQQEYDTIPLPNGVKVPVLPLFGVITETALPLMSIGISQISDSDWNIDDEPSIVVDKRIKLIKQKFADFFLERPNIITEELKNIFKKSERNLQLEKHYQELGQTDIAKKNAFKSRGEPFPNIPWANSENETSPLSFVTISHSDFKLLLSEFVRTFEQVGAGPDGYEVLYNVGFEIGIPLFKSYLPQKKVRTRSYIHFLDRIKEEREQMKEVVDFRLNEVSNLLTNSGIANVQTSGIKFPSSNDSETSSQNGNAFNFEISINRFGNREREDVKYAVMTFSDSEAEFFENLSGISNKQQDNITHLKDLEMEFKKLIRNTWQNSTQTIDWLILGIFKSIACGIAQYLRFDEMAVDSLLFKGVLNSLRQAVKVKIQAGDEEALIVEFSYYEKKLIDDIS